MVDCARAVHTVQEKHVRKSDEGNRMPQMGQHTRLLIDANRDSPSLQRYLRYSARWDHDMYIFVKWHERGLWISANTK